MKTILLVSEKKWNKKLLDCLQSQMPQYSFSLISKKEDFTIEHIEAISPVKIFIPHWSYYIPSVIFNKYECIVFHMTDLPFGRGGSPLQNLIAKGIYETKISALLVTDEIDAGDIFLKRKLSLYGSAEEIFVRANRIVEEMIIDIVRNNLIPTPQKGKVVCFQRRKPEESNIAQLQTLSQIFDYIRMLDADGYPHAFIEINGFRYEFTRASMKADGTIIADVKILPINNTTNVSK